MCHGIFDLWFILLNNEWLNSKQKRGSRVNENLNANTDLMFTQDQGAHISVQKQYYPLQRRWYSPLPGSAKSYSSRTLLGFIYAPLAFSLPF